MSGLAAAKLAFTTSAVAELQPFSGLGFRPSAVVAWWSCQAEHGSRSGNRGGIGFWTADGGAVATGWRSDDGARAIRTEHAARDAAIVGLGAAQGSPAMHAGIRSFDPDGFTLRWTAPPAETWMVHALVLGGASTSARAGWTTAAETVDAADLVLLVPVPGDDLTIGLAAASAGGQAATGYSARDGEPPGTVFAAQRIGAAEIDSASRYAYLALSGVRARVAGEVSPKRPGRRRVRVGFSPEALLLFSWGLAASNDTKRIGRLCVGAIARNASGCTSWDDCNVESETTRTHVASSDEHALVVADTQTGGVHAAAQASLDDRGFTLDWQRQDGGRRQFVYVALGG